MRPASISFARTAARPFIAACLFALGCQHTGEPAPAQPIKVEAPSPPEGDAAPIEAATGSGAGPAAPDGGASEAAAPAFTPPDMSAAPAYPASNLFDAFSKARAKLIACYLPGKKRDPKLRGKVIVKFTINADGTAHPVEDQGSNLEDEAVIACVIRTIKALHFAKPVEGTVTVQYPFIFRPTGDETLILPTAGQK